jgi:hypothetical protein
MGLNSKNANKELDALLWQLLDDYSTEMELEKPFNAAQLLTPQAPSVRVAAKRAFVESIGKTDTFVSEGIISRVQPGAFQLPPGMPVPPQLAQIGASIQFDFEGWKIVR